VRNMLLGDIVRIKKRPDIIGVVRDFVKCGGHLKAVVRIPIKEEVDNVDKGYYEVKIFEEALEKVEKARVFR